MAEALATPDGVIDRLVGFVCVVTFKLPRPTDA